MKKYRLKQWYKSLDEEWDTTHRYEYHSSTGYMCNKSIQHCVIIYKKELHSDFWEEIEEEKPLFITEDGVEIFEGDEYIWRNKRVFSYEDFVRWGNVPYERVIKELAIERIEQ